MADSPNWLSVERREKMLEGHSLHCGVRALVASHAEADRREAELREQLAAANSRIAELQNICESSVRTINQVVANRDELWEQLAAKDAEIARLRVYGDALEHGLYQILPGVIELEMKLDPCPAVKLAQKISAYATSLAKKEFAPQLVGMLENELKDLGVLEQENERLRAALKAADRELINAVCDGAYYKPDETRMKIFRDGLREALVATTPAKEGK